MKHSREGCGVASLSDKLWVVGGNQYGNSDLDIVEWYELKKDRWTQAPPLNEPRWGCGLVAAGMFCCHSYSPSLGFYMLKVKNWPFL